MSRDAHRGAAWAWHQLRTRTPQQLSTARTQEVLASAVALVAMALAGIGLVIVLRLWGGL